MAVSSYRVSEHRHDKQQYRSYGVNSLASLQVNGGPGGGSLGRGSAVRAEALSPSGRRLPVDVVEKPDGTYSANFTPTESGEWEIWIMHGHQHIQGSPFSVRVFEPAPPSVRVYGLDEHKMVGRLANFSIETHGAGGGAGSGKLSVDVSLNGRSIPCKIEPEDDNHFHVSFVPIGSGVYTVRVHYAGVEVTGAPS